MKNGNDLYIVESPSDHLTNRPLPLDLTPKRGYIIFIAKDPMTKNLHLEHPEDEILVGNVDVLDWFACNSTISVKMDGSPAVVWGTNPENGQFFVGTKSVFNKKKIKICYTPDDIEQFYGEQEEVQDILLSCLDFLPRTDRIIQGDFLGFGGAQVYTPNTISYDFGSIVESGIIVCPHTEYTGTSLSTAVAEPLTDTLGSDNNVHFVQPTVDCMHRFADSVNMIRRSVKKSKFLTLKEHKEVKIILNAFIREGKSISPQLLDEIVGDWNLVTSYFQVLDLKEQMMECMKIYDGPQAFIGDQPIDCEGFVRSNKYGTMKLVDRYQFARANFNNNKFS